ncbi:MAG TPA: UDP-N-acetylglucosamine 2-epimerase (non-hydrolyzing) [Myxococcales bacterium]|jgi:UDP-N-acetylglucosamine 2-epimerase (non-hydrolysing)|nr:UDP-N-acetylglucosamine 2-epimerase (non-hydrolyzing) [Myxococcales bacterium]HIM00204.1 UDP-N-acetylglucosamine 2-epimerase (non-hydrolyzing) [Myxococcales bacterium]
MSGASQPAAKKRVRVLCVAGARPNFMKIAPLLREFNSRDTFESFLVHTGQHYDARMSENFFRDLGIPAPDINLGVGSGTHAEQTAHVLMKLEAVLLSERPDLVLVVGDVNSTLAATIAAVKLDIPVAHVEAGLRSGDRTMPEELNRLMTDVVASWLFTTEADGEANLLREGIDPARIHFVGNVMIDTLLANLERAKKLDTLERLGLTEGKFCLLTLHRPSNVDDPARLAELFGALEEIHDRVPIVFPVHPRTATNISEALGGRDLKFQIIEPQDYLDFLRLMADAKIVLTDSGGVQEETTALGTPCFTLRDSTERPITVTHGTNTMVGADREVILREVMATLDGKPKAGNVPDLWDGKASERIANVLERDLGAGS